MSVYPREYYLGVGPSRGAAATKSMEDFIRAFDAWALSTEICGGPLFDRMLEAREDVDFPQLDPMPAEE